MGLNNYLVSLVFVFLSVCKRTGKRKLTRLGSYSNPFDIFAAITGPCGQGPTKTFIDRSAAFSWDRRLEIELKCSATFCRTFEALDLVSLPNYNVCMRLIVDGEVSQPFSAETIKRVA